jgi:hypothetical protein
MVISYVVNSIKEVSFQGYQMVITTTGQFEQMCTTLNRVNWRFKEMIMG